MTRKIGLPDPTAAKRCPTIQTAKAPQGPQVSLARDLAWSLDINLWAAEALGFEADPIQREILACNDPQALIVACRQFGKSSTVALRAAHVSAFEAGSLVLMVAPSQRQANLLFGKTIDNLKGLNPKVEFLSDNRQSAELSNKSKIVSLPGDGRRIRGFSAPRLVAIDEAAYVEDATYESIRPFMAASPRGQLLAMSSPGGRRGWLWRAWSEEGPLWRRFHISADQCPRIPAEFLERERLSMPAWRFRSEYMAEFVGDDASLFNFDDVEACFSGEFGALYSGAAECIR